MMDIDIKDIRAKNIDAIIAAQSAEKARVFVYGAGLTARRISDYLEQNGIQINANIVDDAFYRSGNGVIPYSEFISNVNVTDIVVFGFASYSTAVKKQDELSQKGIKSFFFPFPYSFNIDGTYITQDIYKNNKEKYTWLYDRLDDSESKCIYKAYIEGQISGDITSLQKYSKGKQYFEDFIPKDVETFVDCGAYIGDTLESTFGYFDRIKKYYAFEPDPNNQKKLMTVIERYADRGEIVVKNAGVYDRSTVLGFSLSDSSSSISEDGEQRINVVALDNEILMTENEKVYIKMDVEGSELSALNGTKDLIASHHPILAICIYHNILDLYQIPMYIDSISSGSYKYIVRYYGNNFRELVLYAI